MSFGKGTIRGEPMDQIFDRLGNLLRSFVQDDKSSREYRRSAHEDPDMQDAWDELNEFLSAGPSTSSPAGGAYTGGASAGGSGRYSGAASAMPGEVRSAYEYLGVPPGTPIEEVSKTYKKLLRTHHPDRFATDPAKLAEATEKTKRINFAFQQIRDYHRTKPKQ